MTRSEAIKAFFIKSMLPVAAAMLLYCIFKSVCMKGGKLDYVWLWILCGLPFGLHRMCLWIIPGGGSFGGCFRFLNNLPHLLFHLYLPLHGGIEIVCLIRPFLRTEKDRLDDLARDHLQRLPVPLIHGEQEQGQHDHDHADRGGAGIDRFPEQKEKRYSNECRRPETHKLPPGQAKQHLALYFCQILRDRYIRQ